MAEPSYPPLSSPVAVIGSQFIVPYQFDFIVDRNSRGNLVINDMSHKIMLKVKPCDTSFHHQRLLLDVDEKPIVLMRKKVTFSSVLILPFCSLGCFENLMLSLTLK